MRVKCTRFSVDPDMVFKGRPLGKCFIALFTAIGLFAGVGSEMYF